MIHPGGHDPPRCAATAEYIGDVLRRLHVAPAHDGAVNYFQ